MSALDPSVEITCRSCGTRVPKERPPARCPACGGLLDVTYRQSGVGRLDSDPTSMWADELLPVGSETAVSLGEGGTPTIESTDLAGALGVSAFHVKDEGQNPTGTIADRGMALATTVAASQGVEAVSLAAPGAAGQSLAAYAARAGLEATVFLPARAPFEHKAMVNVHGADLTVVQGRLPEAIDTLWATREQADPGRPFGGFEMPFRHVGARTVAYEIAALDALPDTIAVPVGTGCVIVGLYEGFRDLLALDLVDSMPRLVAVQPAGSAPVVEALTDGSDPEPPAYPDTVCGELEVPDPPGGAWAIEAVESTGGTGIAVEDEQILDAGLTLAETAGIETRPAGAAAFAGLQGLSASGWLDPGESVLAVSVGSGGADLLRSRIEARPR